MPAVHPGGRDFDLVWDASKAERVGLELVRVARRVKPGAVSDAPPPLPAGPFDLILADPGLVCAAPEASFSPWCELVHTTGHAAQ